MPGKYCCIPGCYTNETPKYDGIHLLQITTLKSKGYFDYDGWREQIIRVLCKYRNIGKWERNKIKKGEFHICSEHYLPEDIYMTKTGKWKVDLGKLPTQKLPEKSFEPEKKEERRHLNIVKDYPVKIAEKKELKKHDSYKSFQQFEGSLSKLKLNGWDITKNTNYSFKYFKDPTYLIPSLEVIINENLVFSILVYGWSLPNNSQIYETYQRSLKNVKISALLNEINKLIMCNGLNLCNPPAIEHCIPFKVNDIALTDGSPTQNKKFYRASDCSLLLTSDVQICCNKCRALEKKESKLEKQKNIAPAKKKAPLSKTNPQRVVLALKQERIDHKNQLKKMEKSILKKGVEVKDDLKSDFFDIMEKDESASPFVKLFWGEQKRMAKGNPNAIRYHPMIIRYCLSLASKSSSAYDELRSSGILTLPSRRTLKDYTNFIKPSTGFNPQVTVELIRLASNLKGYQRFVCLSFDEVKIQDNLVFDKYTGELIGFLDLGDADLNEYTFDKPDKLASHIMVFYLRSLTGDFKFSFSYFGTDGMTAFQLMILFWDAVSILEVTCKIPVICCVSDGASSNRKFYKMHWLMSNQVGDITYRTVNLFAKDRYIYFFADVPHLMKTSRNALAHSYPGGTRNLWNKDGCLMWDHLRKIVMDDLDRGTKKMNKLTLNHINLNSYSSMKVSYATQVLSSSVARLLKRDYPGTLATAKFCENMDKFFDCLNTRNLTEHKRLIKPFLQPYVSTNDSRFDWLRKDFLDYLQNWKDDVYSNKNVTAATDKEKMFLPVQTYEGLIITVNSLIETTCYALNHGMQFFNSVNLNQDCLEEHFGKHRGCAGRNTNPNLYQFGFQENKIRIQKYSTKLTGNTSGRFSGKKYTPWFEVDNEPLPKRSAGSGMF